MERHNLTITGADLMFRASSFGELMGGLTRSTLTDKQQATLEELLTKVTITEKQAVERDRLLEKRDSEPTLSDGAKTHVEKMFREEVRGTSPYRFESKYTDKGNRLEDSAIVRIARVNGWLAPMNANKIGVVLKDDLGEGHPDVIYKNERFGFDAKCSFSDDTFPLFANDLKQASKSYNNYLWQAKRYAMMAGYDHWYICFSLENTPLDIVEGEAWKLWKLAGKQGQYTDDFFDEVRQMHNFDHLPDWARVKTFRVDVTEDDRKLAKSHVDLARKYFDDLKRDYNKNI